MKFFLYALALILITLNLVGVIAISWWLAFAPIILLFGFYLMFVILGIGMAVTASKF